MAGMTDTSHLRVNILALLAVLTLSAAIMVWLFWHYPLITAGVTVAVLTALGVSARLARYFDTADITDLRRSNRGI
jgi:uncharacterized membrane protein YqjE